MIWLRFRSWLLWQIPHAVKEKYRKHIIGVLKKNSDISFVAVKDGKVIGYVQAEVFGSRAVIERYSC